MAQGDEQQAYERKEWEIAQYGCPDDGYDYTVHFKTIGGRGGVFVPVLGAEESEKKSRNEFKLREDDQKAPALSLDNFPVLSKQDLVQTTTNIDDFEKIRRRNADLDEVFAQLDLEGSCAGSEDFSIAELDADDDLIPHGALIETAEKPVPVKPSQTLLDAQFDNLMKSYADEEHEDEDDLDVIQDDTGCDSASEYDAHELQALAQDPSVLLELADKGVDLSIDGPNFKVEDKFGDRFVKFEPEEHAEDELSNALNKMIHSRDRVSAEDAFSAIDGLDGARKAIKAREEMEKAKLEDPQHDSDSHDSELDSMIDSMAGDRDRWDCQTIISTYSNLDNHPSIVDEGGSVQQKRRTRQLPPVIRLDPRTHLPRNDAVDDKHSGEKSRHEFGAPQLTKPVTSARRKGETAEEKRARKAAVKELARSRRKVKSEMKKVFASEEIVQQRHAVSLGKSKISTQH